MSATRTAQLDETGYDGMSRRIERQLAVECPIAIEVNGVAYAVMMGTPVDLEDYALGFAMAEGLINAPAELSDLSVSVINNGVILRLVLSEQRAAPLLERVRMRVSEGSCGLCGLESIAEVLRPLARLPTSASPDPRSVQRALLALPEHQTEGSRTGAMHAAAFCTPSTFNLTNGVSAVWGS